MSELMQRITETVRTAWSGMTGLQKAGLFLLVVAMAFISSWTIMTATEPEERLLVGAEEPEHKRKKVVEVLGAAEIPYTLKQSYVYVKTEDHGRATLELAGEGIFSDADVYKWLTDVDLTATRWRNDKRWQVSQQRKLENALRQMNAIDRASVMISPATSAHQALGSAGGRPRATVNVRAKAGHQITTKVATAIAAMIKGAVPMLKREDVTVIDDSSSLVVPVAGDSSQLYESYHLHELEKKTAEWITKNVRMALEIVLPKFSVIVNVKFNGKAGKSFTQSTDEEKSFVLRTLEEKLNEERYPIGFDPSTLVKGALTLDLKTAGPYVKKDSSKKESDPNPSFITERSEWNVGSDIEFINVAVVIPDNVLVDPGAPGTPVANKNTVVDAITKTVFAAAGYGDPKKLKVNVSTMPSFIIPPTPLEMKFWEILTVHLGEWGRFYLLLILSLVALFLVYKIVRAALARGAVEPMEEAVTRAEIETPEYAEWQEAEEVAERVRAQIRDMVARNPRAVAGVLKRWMSSS